MACSINGCLTKGDEPNIVLYPFPRESRESLELLEQWRQYVGQVAWRRGRGHVCSRHFPTPPTPTDFPTIDLPPDTENRKKYPEQLVLRKKVSDIEMEKTAQKMVYNPEEFMNASKLKMGNSGITYTKLWLLSKWRKHLSSYLIYRDAAMRAIRDAPEWMRRADDELQLVHYILQKDHLHEYSSFLRAVAGSVPRGGHASLVHKYCATEEQVLTVWSLFSCLVRMKLQWLSCRGDVWRQLPRVARLSPVEWEYSGQVIMDDDHVQWALIYSVSALGRSILVLLQLAKLYKLEDYTASRELRERRWAAACRVYRKSRRCCGCDICDHSNQRSHKAFLRELHCRELRERRWAAACRVYRKSGLHCPPLLLQRRWQQLKQDARQAIAAPHKYRPHLYHWLLVCRWPHVVTQALPTWQQLNARGFVYDLKEHDLEKLEPVEPEDKEDNEDFLAFLKNMSIKLPDLQSDGHEDIRKNLVTNNGLVAIPSKTKMKDHLKRLNSKLLKCYSVFIVTHFSNIERENMKEQHQTYSESKQSKLSRTDSSIFLNLDEQSKTCLNNKIQKKKQNETLKVPLIGNNDNEATKVIDTIKELESLDPRKAETTIIIESDEEMELCDNENKEQILMDVDEFQSETHSKEDLEVAYGYPMQAFKRPKLENDSNKVEPKVEDIKNEPYASPQTDEFIFPENPDFVKKEKDSDIGVNKAKSRTRILFEDSSDSCGSDAESACAADDGVKVDEKLLMDTKVVLEKVDSEQYLSSIKKQRIFMEQPNLVNVPKSESECILSNPIQSYTSKLISEINSEESEKSLETLKQAKFIIEPEVPSNKDIAEPIPTNVNPMQFGFNDQSDSDSDDSKLYVYESDSESTQPIITKFKTQDEFQTSKLKVSESEAIESEYEQILAKLMQSGSGKVLPESKHILSESKQIESESEHIQSESEHIQSESEHNHSESENTLYKSYKSRTLSGKVEDLLPFCRPLSVTLQKLSPQECAKSWSWADVGRPVSLPVRGQARLLPVAQVKPIRPATSDDADKGGVCFLTTLQNMIQKELKNRTERSLWHCCGARSLMELIDRRRNRNTVHTVPTLKQRHLEKHRDQICRCCCRWLIRDSPPWSGSLLYSHRTLRAALDSVAKIRKDDDANKHTLFDSVTLISSDDDNENTVILKRKKYKKKSNKTKHTEKVPETEEDAGPSTGDRDYDEWMRQKTQYKRFFFIESMIGKSKAKETTEAETQAPSNAEKTQLTQESATKTQSNIAPTQESATKTQSNIAPTQESATKTQSNIAPTQESATKTQSNIAPTQEFATKTQSSNVTSQNTCVESEANKTIANPLLHIANIMEQKYKNVVFATSEKKAKSMAEDALELALKVTRPQKASNTVASLTLENVAFHTQMQDIMSGPSTSANLNAPIVGNQIDVQNCIIVPPVHPKVQKPAQITPKLIYLGKSVDPTGQPSTRQVFKLLQKANMPQVLQNNTSPSTRQNNTSPSTGQCNVVFNPAPTVNMPSVLKRYTQNYTPLEQAQENLTKTEEFILPTTEPATVTQNTSVVLTNRSLLKSPIQNVVSNRSLLRSAVQDVESNIIKEVPYTNTKDCTQKNKKGEIEYEPSYEDVYVQIPASEGKRSEPLVIKLPNVVTYKHAADQNLSKISITKKKCNISNQTVIKIKRGEEDTSASLHKHIPMHRTLCRNGKPILRVRAPFVSKIVEKGQCVPVITYGTNHNTGSKPVEAERVPDVTDNSEVLEDDTNASGRNSPDVVMVTDEPEVVDLTDDNDDTRRYFVCTTVP